MKINREVNGQVIEFELTSDELYNAFLEQEHKFDRSDILSKLEDCKDASENAQDFFEYYGVSYRDVLSNDSLIDRLAREKRHNQDKHDMEWEHARDEAFKDVLGDYKLELKGLPDMCYSVLPSTGEVIIITRGETGYRQTSFENIDVELNKELVDEANRKLCVSKAQAAAMQAGSMFGWDAPAADTSAYDENGTLKPVEKPALDSVIKSAQAEKDTAVSGDVEMTYAELKSFFSKVEKAHGGHVSGHIVFSKDSFQAEYDLQSRTYVVSSNNKAFQSNMGGYSIFGSCLDGTDINVRLEQYMANERGGQNGWKIERCYVSRDEYNKGLNFIDALNKDAVR